MSFTRHSKIGEIWRHPVGHDILQSLLRKKKWHERWLNNMLVSNLSVAALDRVVGNGFADMLLDAIHAAPQQPTQHVEESKEWWKETVQYHIFLPSFMDSDHDGVGDIGGVIQRLPYLERLGVGALSIWPLLEPSPNQGVENFSEVAPQYGSNAQLQELIEAAHQRGIRVLLGIDIATTSLEHEWYRRALQEPDYQNHYVFYHGRPDTPPNNWSRKDGSSAWEWVPALNKWNLRLQAANKADLNWDNAVVREKMFDALNFWAALGADGFYFGSVNQLNISTLESGNFLAAQMLGVCGYEKFSNRPRGHRYLRQLRRRVKGDVPLFLAGEAAGAGTETMKLFTAPQRKELDMTWDSCLLFGAAAGDCGDDARVYLTDIRDYYIRWTVRYGEENWLNLAVENATTSRILSRVVAAPLYRNIIAKLLATMMLTLRGVPVIYQGQELGMTNTRFCSAKELRDETSLKQYQTLRGEMDEGRAFQRVVHATPDHCRTPMPWSLAPNAGFTGAKPWIRMPDDVQRLNVATQMQDPSSVWHFHKELIALRSRYQSLCYGDIKIVFRRNKRVFCYFRALENEKCYVEMNLTDKEVARPGSISKTQALLLSNYDKPCKTLRPYEANIYLCK